MKSVVFSDNEKFGYGFIEGDEYRFRDIQNGGDENYRHINEKEFGILQQNGNVLNNPDDFYVSQKGFDPNLILNNRFFGKIRLGLIKHGYLKFHDLEVPVGIYESEIISSDIGDLCAINKLSYLNHYIIKNHVIIQNVFEMQTTNHSKFGNGILKDGEDPDVRIKLHIMNENEGRSVYPFDSMIPADAYLWGKYRDRTALMKAFETLTDNSYSHERGWYGVVEDNCVIKGTRIIKDVNLGPSTYVKGADKLKNLTIKSREDEPTQLGEGITLVNGIVGPGSRIFYGVKAVRFICGENTNLKYGARLINSFLGDNSTISCCEVISNLIFPFHEQHHNNSFLISSTLKGQSNMAAGANIGSNHNSRGPDGEMEAGRGFWPALSSTIKFDSHFASFTLIDKGNYPYEINLRLPFCLLTSNRETGCREIMPAYWWMYNMYATERNGSKFNSRDNRIVKKQHIVTDYLAPDSVNEIIEGRQLIRKWTAESFNCTEKNAVDILENKTERLEKVCVSCCGVEKSKNTVSMIKPSEGYSAYGDMLLYYAVKEVGKWCYDNKLTFKQFEQSVKDEQNYMNWENIGGQLVPRFRLEQMFADLGNGKYSLWEEVHQQYDRWWDCYEEDKTIHSLAVLHKIFKKTALDRKDWEKSVLHLIKTRNYIDREVRKTKEKDYTNKFRKITFSNNAEHDAVIGCMEDNSFVQKCIRNSIEIDKQIESISFS